MASGIAAVAYFIEATGESSSCLRRLVDGPDRATPRPHVQTTSDSTSRLDLPRHGTRQRKDEAVPGARGLSKDSVSACRHVPAVSSRLFPVLCDAEPLPS